MADELFQKVLVKISKSNPKWETDSEIKAWLSSVVRSVVYDDLRKQKRSTFEIRALSVLDSEYLETLEQQQSLRAIERLNTALEGLDMDDSNTVRAVYIDREPRAIVAERLGISYKALESKLVRLRKKLKQVILEDIGNER